MSGLQPRGLRAAVPSSYLSTAGPPHHHHFIPSPSPSSPSSLLPSAMVVGLGGEGEGEGALACSVVDLAETMVISEGTQSAPVSAEDVVTSLDHVFSMQDAGTDFVLPHSTGPSHLITGHGLVSDNPETLRIQYPLDDESTKFTNSSSSSTSRRHPAVYREQDRFLPIANVARIMRNVLPKNGKISKDAKECMQECVSEYISFITSEACDRCVHEKRKTITGDDLLYAMATLGFDHYIEPLQFYLQAYREFVRSEKVSPLRTEMQEEQ